MTSKIEQLIDEIEDYIDSCKNQPLSNTKIVVNKDEIKALIRELRQKTPEELSKYQKIVSNQQAILNEAKKKAEALINDAAQQTSEMLNQNSIMKQAYAQADEVVKVAWAQANEIVTKATIEANEYRNAIVEYTDNLLANYEYVVGQTLNVTKNHYESFYSQISQFHETVVQCRMELNPPMIESTTDIPADFIDEAVSADNQEFINPDTGNIQVQQGTQPMANPQVNIQPEQAYQQGSNQNIKVDLL